MRRLQLRQISTRDGVVGVYAPEIFDDSRPVLVAIPGARRTVYQLVVWAELLWDQVDVALVDMPGYGTSSPILPATLDRLSDNIVEAVVRLFPGRTMILLGESLGGLVAIRMATMPELDLLAVVAADPPLTTVKQAQLQRAFKGFIEEEAGNEFTRSLSFEMFGYLPNEDLVERNRYDLLAAVRLPIDIVTGDYNESLAERSSRVRCLIDEVDRFVVERLYPGRAHFHVLPGAGHLVLEDQRDLCLALLQDRLVNPVAGGASL